MKTNKELIAIARAHPVCSCEPGEKCLACVMREMADRLQAADAEIERLKGLLIFAWDYVNRGPALHLLDAEEWRWIRDLCKGQK